MKIKFQYITVFIALISMVACKKDNFDAPATTLNGKLVYQGESINLQYDRVPFELYQYGFGKVGGINSTFSQEGTYSAMLFDGQYKLIIPNGQGPFRWNQNAAGGRDSVTIDLKGNKTLDLEVTPYYLPHNPQVTVKGRNIYGTFTADKIITDAGAKNIEYVTICANKTQFVSAADNIAIRTRPNGAIDNPAGIELIKYLPTAAVAQGYYFVRFGIKVDGVEDLIFTPVIKINTGEIENYARIEAEASTLVGLSDTTDIDNTGGSAGNFVRNINQAGKGVDFTINATTAGDYIINVGAGTDIKGSTHIIYIDGNEAAAKTVAYYNEGAKSFEITPVEYTLTAGTHTVSIRKTAATPGQANLDYIELFKLK